MIEIPLFTDPQYTVRADLGTEGAEVQYEFEFRYLQRADLYLMSMYTADGEALFEGRPVLLGVRYLLGNTSTRRPPGDLIFVDSTTTNVDAGRNDLGSRVSLIYLTPEDIAAA